MWSGLGTLYGDNELHDKMDQASIMRTVDSTLWNHFQRLVYAFVLKITWVLQLTLLYLSFMLSRHRQRLSYDDCLEDQSEVCCAILCIAVVHSLKHTHISSF